MDETNHDRTPAGQDFLSYPAPSPPDDPAPRKRRLPAVAGLLAA